MFPVINKWQQGDNGIYYNIKKSLFVWMSLKNVSVEIIGKNMACVKEKLSCLKLCWNLRAVKFCQFENLFESWARFYQSLIKADDQQRATRSHLVMIMVITIPGSLEYQGVLVKHIIWYVLIEHCSRHRLSWPTSIGNGHHWPLMINILATSDKYIRG